MELDPETYLVSAEAHNVWRGAVPYDSYPMRRIGYESYGTAPRQTLWASAETR